MLKNIIYKKPIKSMKYLKTYEQTNSLDLIKAVKDNNLEKVKELIKAGANLDLQDSGRNTALIWASYRGYIDIVKELIKAGADWNLKDNDNNSDFLYYLTYFNWENKIIEGFPEEYQLYLVKKDSEKYNL